MGTVVRHSGSGTLVAAPPEPLSTPVELCQLHDEFQACLRLFRDAAPSKILEIGTASGGTLYHWLKNLRVSAATVVSVDFVEPDYPLDRGQVATWAPPGVQLVLMEGDSHDPKVVGDVRSHGPYDWVFIDGNHRYQHAKADLDNYWPMVAPAGYLCLHDIRLDRRYDDGAQAGVSRLWDEIRAAGHWTLELRGDEADEAYGIGIVRGNSDPLMP